MITDNWAMLWEFAACGLPASNGAARIITGKTPEIVTLEWPDGLQERMRWDGRAWWSHGDGSKPSHSKDKAVDHLGPYRNIETLDQARANIAALELANAELRLQLSREG